MQVADGFPLISLIVDVLIILSIPPPTPCTRVFISIVRVLSHSVVSDSLQHHGLHVAHQAPLSMEFSKQEYWSGLPFPPPGELPNPGIKPLSPASPALASGAFTTEPLGKPIVSGSDP